ncbi:MAG: GAF domain-containing protein [Candidatus Neomarinimicrobiota bacterium]|nr:MAG: GAF domain-containing protein [Candidatus Neomarinimicrobiota bacterium]
MTKQERYQAALRELQLLFEPGHYSLDPIGKMATIATVLHRTFPDWLFVGFYRVAGDRRLIIGPYQGPVLACGSIDFGRGVCGTAADRESTLIVRDVTRFPGYIACDDETRSEIVVPVFEGDQLRAVLDVDGPGIGDFDSADAAGLEPIAALVY